MLYEQSLSEAYYGRLTNAREFIQRAAAWARRNDLYGTAAYDLASFAIIEADFGDAAAAHRSASESLTDSKVSGGRMASLALGRQVTSRAHRQSLMILPRDTRPPLS